MALAYTPGLKRKESYVIRKIRRLPIEGEVIVKEGDQVTHTAILATTYIPGRAQTLNAAEILGLIVDQRSRSSELNKYMFKKQGDPVEKDELIAMRKELFGLVKKPMKSPIKGTLEYVSDVSGQIILREPQGKVSIGFRSTARTYPFSPTIIRAA